MTVDALVTEEPLTTSVTAEPPTTSVRRSWRAWSVGTLAAFILLGVWAVSLPPYSGPDETSQAIHAAALVRGQWIGTPQRGVENPTTVVRVPGTFGDSANEIRCYFWQPAVSASCASKVRLTSDEVTTWTYSGRYPPLYYALTGLATLVDQSHSALVWMRLVGALACAVLLGLAYMVLDVWSRNRFLAVGFLCALTPTAVYMCSVVNPNGLEIAAAITLWCSGAVLALERLESPPVGLVVVIAVSAGVLVSTRGLSPLLAFLIFAALIVLAGPRAVMSLYRRRRDVRWATAVVVFVTVVSVVWILLVHSLWLLPAGPQVKAHASEASIVGLAFSQTHLWLQQMVGVLGWDETFVPSWTFRIWAIVVLALLVLALRSRQRRALIVIGLLVALTFLMPVGVSLIDARTVGIPWQGRYTLPLATGIPIVCAALAGSTPRARRLWIQATCVVALTVGSALAFLETMRRYSVGNHGPLIDFFSGRWRPPEGWALTLIWYGGACVLYSALLLRLCGPTRFASHRGGASTVPPLTSPVSIGR